MEFGDREPFVAQIKEFVHQFSMGLDFRISIDDDFSDKWRRFFKAIGEHDLGVGEVRRKISLQGFRRRNVSSSGFEM